MLNLKSNMCTIRIPFLSIEGKVKVIQIYNSVYLYVNLKKKNYTLCIIKLIMHNNVKNKNKKWKSRKMVIKRNALMLSDCNYQIMQEIAVGKWNTKAGTYIQGIMRKLLITWNICIIVFICLNTSIFSSYDH